MDFQWVDTPEPHATRRREILKKHPEIKVLFGHNPASKYYASATIALQCVLAYYCTRPTTPWWHFLALSYVVGGTCSHSLTLAIHEMSHDLFFKKTIHNKLFSFVCNWPLVVPYAASFKKYHLEHHKAQGEDGVDVDIPTALEGKFFTSPLRKFLWVLFQPAFYAIRPLIINPKPLVVLDIINIFTQLLFLVTLYMVTGWGGIGYMTLSTWWGLGLHPCAGHFIAEHYTNIWSSKGPHNTGQAPLSADDQKLWPDETFSYHGPLNLVSYYVGYHVAHHDFPNVAGSRLAEIEKLAPEFYAHLPKCESWPGTIWRYIFSDTTPFDRIKRKRGITAAAAATVQGEY